MVKMIFRLKRNINVICQLLLIFAFLPKICIGDEFAELEKKQKEIGSKDPFANKSANCITNLESGHQLKDSFQFYGGINKFWWTNGSGKYEVKGDVLILRKENKQTDTNTSTAKTVFEFKFKIDNGGFKYIHEGINRSTGAAFKNLYTCVWVPSK